MTLSFLIMLMVVVPCVFVVGVLVGYPRGRRDAERDLASTLNPYKARS